MYSTPDNLFEQNFSTQFIDVLRCRMTFYHVKTTRMLSLSQADANKFYSQCWLHVIIRLRNRNGEIVQNHMIKDIEFLYKNVSGHVYDSFCLRFYPLFCKLQSGHEAVNQSLVCHITSTCTSLRCTLC